MTGRCLLRPARAWLALALVLAGNAGSGRLAVAGTVVLLRSSALSSHDAAAEGFRAAYRDPVNEFVLDQGDPAQLAGRIRALRPDAVVAVGLKAALLVRDQLPRTPMVFCNIKHPERYDLAGSWITGVSSEIPPGDELKALRGVAPDIHRVAVFFGAATGTEFSRALPRAAAAAGVEVISVAVSDVSELASRAREASFRSDAFWLPADPTVALPEAFQFLLKLSLDQRKPLLVFSDALVRAGALVAVSADYAALGQQLADAVRRTQAGERPGDIPVSAPRRTRMVVNRTTAEALGRELSAATIRAYEVIR